MAKHGNRSVSSKSGAADVLERLGAELALTAEQAETVLEDTGMCFLFAPAYHSSMKYAAPVRKEIGIRSIFNILGPLSNPAGASMQLLGVYSGIWWNHWPRCWLTWELPGEWWYAGETDWMKRHLPAPPMYVKSVTGKLRL